MKACTKCGEVKLLEEFNRQASRSDGRKSACRECTSKATADYLDRNGDRLNQERRERYAADVDYRRGIVDRVASARRGAGVPARPPVMTDEERRARRREQYQEWRKANPEKAKAATRAWAEANPEKVRARRRAHYRRNPSSYMHRAHARRLRLAAGDQRLILDKEMNRLYSSPCAVCGARDRIQADHVIPIARGGRHSIGNLQPLCQPCNGSKSDRLMAEWLLAASRASGSGASGEVRSTSTR